MRGWPFHRSYSVSRLPLIGAQWDKDTVSWSPWIMVTNIRQKKEKFEIRAIGIFPDL